MVHYYPDQGRCVMSILSRAHPSLSLHFSLVAEKEGPLMWIGMRFFSFICLRSSVIRIQRTSTHPLLSICAHTHRTEPRNTMIKTPFSPVTSALKHHERVTRLKTESYFFPIRAEFPHLRRRGFSLGSLSWRWDFWTGWSIFVCRMEPNGRLLCLTMLKFRRLRFWLLLKRQILAKYWIVKTMEGAPWSSACAQVWRPKSL